MTPCARQPIVLRHKRHPAAQPPAWKPSISDKETHHAFGQHKFSVRLDEL